MLRLERKNAWNNNLKRRKHANNTMGRRYAANKQRSMTRRNRGAKKSTKKLLARLRKKANEKSK
jgi:hypothetical protein